MSEGPPVVVSGGHCTANSSGLHCAVRTLLYSCSTECCRPHPLHPGASPCIIAVHAQHLGHPVENLAGIAPCAVNLTRTPFGGTIKEGRSGWLTPYPPLQIQTLSLLRGGGDPPPDADLLSQCSLTKYTLEFDEVAPLSQGLCDRLEGLNLEGKARPLHSWTIRASSHTKSTAVKALSCT